MIRQGLRQTLVEGGVLHVNHHTVNGVRGNLVCQAMGFILRRHGGHRDVTRTIREQDYQGLNIWVQDPLAL